MYIIGIFFRYDFLIRISKKSYKMLFLALPFSILLQNKLPVELYLKNTPSQLQIKIVVLMSAGIA